ncbi:MAG: glycoside hydrolase family 10 protein [Cyanobacteria bacterium P01_A01_bin.3]
MSRIISRYRWRRLLNRGVVWCGIGLCAIGLWMAGLWWYAPIYWGSPTATRSTLAQSLLQQTALTQPIQAQVPLAQVETRGVWITANDTGMVSDRTRMQAAITQLSRLNFNTVYPVVWNSGYVLYPSTVARNAGIQPFVRQGNNGQDILAELIETAHREQIAVLPWFEFGFMTPPTSELALAHPQWLTQRQDGTQTIQNAAGEVVWMNPLHPEVQQFITDLVLELVSRYDIDGIQFDDHASFPVEFGYDSYTLDLYRSETGQNPPSDPNNSNWKRWRANKLTDYMGRLRQAVKTSKPNVVFSIAPTTYLTAYNSFLQDWVDWVERGIADEAIVQIYRHDLQSFNHEVQKPEMQAARGKIPLGVGILAGLRTKPVSSSSIQNQVQTARASGLGLTFFSYESLWETTEEPPEARQALFQSLFGRRRVPRATKQFDESPVYEYRRATS